MSIAAQSLGEGPISDQASAATQKPPKPRILVAKADRLNAPEAR